MMRIRTVKPEFFTHEALAGAEAEHGLPLRLAFVGLWCAADREGRFRWQPGRLKCQILPYDKVDFAAVMDALKALEVIVQYGPKNEFGMIPSFTRHQRVHIREAQSDIPDLPKASPAQASTKPKPSPSNAKAKPRQSQGKQTTTPSTSQGTAISTGNGMEGKGREGSTSVVPLRETVPAVSKKQDDKQPSAEAIVSAFKPRERAIPDMAREIYNSYRVGYKVGAPTCVQCLVRRWKPADCETYAAKVAKFEHLMQLTMRYVNSPTGQSRCCRNSDTFFRSHIEEDDPDSWETDRDDTSKPKPPLRPPPPSPLETSVAPEFGAHKDPEVVYDSQERQPEPDSLDAGQPPDDPADLPGPDG